MTRPWSSVSAWLPAALMILAACLATPAPAAAENATPELARVWARSGTIEIEPLVEAGGLLLTVSGPDGFHHRQVLDPRGGATVSDLSLDKSASLPDGSYTYELRAVPEETRSRAGDPAAETGLEHRARAPHAPRVQTGSFAVLDGLVVAEDLTEPGAEVPGAGAENTLATKDFAVNDDLIVTGSTCMGFGCVSGEAFGFDTIRLKENNLRIKFQDTSTASAFPSNDWELTANDSASGGLNRFSIRDVDGERDVFTVEAGAREAALYVKQQGRVGFGTSTPVTELHAVSGDAPTLRLEQDSSAGFNAQTWDVAGNEANFFVRDASNGSTLPFRIRPGAPTSSIDIAASGNVGVGTGSPEAKLHVENGSVLVQNSSNPGFNLEDDDGAGASSWTFELNGNGLFQMNKAGSGGPEILVRERADGTGGQETLDVDGSIEADNFNVSSSRTFKTGFEPVDRNEILAQVLDLPIQEWSFKWDRRGSRHIGPMAENFLDLFGVGSTDSISILDATGIAMAAIQGLHEVVEDRDRELRELREEVADLREMLKDLSVSGDSQ